MAVTANVVNTSWSTTFSGHSPRRATRGDIAEIMIFDVALDATARGAIEAALKTKYGL